MTYRDQFIFLFLALAILTTACSNVKVALYDKDKRTALAEESKKALANSGASKEMNFRHSVVEEATSQIGKRYKYGSIDPKQGFDCSGLVNYVGRQHQMTLPRSSTALATGVPHIAWQKSNTGDFVFFGDRNKIDHVAIVEENKNDELWVIHSTTQRGVYRENVLVSPYWKKRILFAVDLNSYKATKVKS